MVCIKKNILFNQWIIFLVFIIGISTLILSPIFPEAFSQTTIPIHKPDGIVRQNDERIYIVQHSGYSMLEGIEGIFEFSDSIIYGDIVNLSDDTVYYIIMRGNVYRDEELWQKTGFQQIWTFRYDYPWQVGNPTELAISPYKLTLRPGEAAPFTLWPGQSGWDCYEVWVESYELENKELHITEDRMRNDVVIRSGELDNRGTYKGKVFNPTENIIRHTYVILVKYDVNNEIFAILGDDVGPLSPNTAKSFEISAYTPGYPIKTHTTNFLYGKPHRVEVLAWGYTEHTVGDSGVYDIDDDIDDKHPVHLMAESQYYPNEPLPQYMNLEEIREKAEQDRQKPINTNFCLGGEDTTILSGQAKPAAKTPESKILTAKTQIPDWIRNTAKWWAEGGIGDNDFVYGIQYLIKQRIMQIPVAVVSDSEAETKNKSVTEHGYIELDGTEFFVSRYNPAVVTITGKVEDYGGGNYRIECDLAKPNAFFEDPLSISVTSDEVFSNMMEFTNDFEPGDYSLDCKYKGRDIGSVSFSLSQSSEEKPLVKDSEVEKNIPEWIKNNADWWSQGLISDDDFVKGIQYLVEQGIIKV